MSKKKKLAEDMSPEELRELAAKKEQEELYKVRKTGILKHDLFWLKYDVHNQTVLDMICDLIDKNDEYCDSFYSEPQVSKICSRIREYLFGINKAKDSITIPKGTKFSCFIDGDEEIWCDGINAGLENADKVWAEQHLENIKEI